MPLFIIPNNHALKNPVELEPEDVHHLTNVQRAKKGDIIFLTDNQGLLAKCRITNITPPQFCVEKITFQKPPAPITVALPLIRQDRLEWAVQKLCELDIQAVQLIITERTQQKSLSGKKHTRLVKTAHEAQKQCLRTYPLIICDVMPLKKIKINPQKRYVAAHPENSQTIPLPETRGKRDTIIFIGPEGGFSPAEIVWCKSKKIPFMNLGQTVLKTETAALVVAGLIKYCPSLRGST